MVLGKAGMGYNGNRCPVLSVTRTFGALLLYQVGDKSPSQSLSIVKDSSLPIMVG
jgi:hypothetical protein